MLIPLLIDEFTYLEYNLPIVDPIVNSTLSIMINHQ